MEKLQDMKAIIKWIQIKSDVVPIIIVQVYKTSNFNRKQN